jgi:hypothetical protein
MGDLPSDAREQLREQFEEVARASEQREPDRATTALAAAERTVDSLLSPEAGRVFDHGIGRVRVLVRDEPLVAAEWARAMARRLAEVTDGHARDVETGTGDRETEEREDSRRDRSDGTD